MGLHGPVIAVFDVDNRAGGSGFLLSPRLAITAHHLTEGGIPSVSVLTSEAVESIKPGEFASKRIVPSKIVSTDRDVALMEFEHPFDVRTSRIVVTSDDGTTLLVTVKGYPTAFADMNEKTFTYLPIQGGLAITASAMHGGNQGRFLTSPEMFADPKKYEGLSGAVLTYRNQPLAVQTQVWPGDPNEVEFCRLDFLFSDFGSLLEMHGVEPLDITTGPQLFAGDGENFAVAEALPVPVIEIGTEELDSMRTRDFTLDDDY